MNTRTHHQHEEDHYCGRPRLPVPVSARGRRRLPRDLRRAPPVLAFGETLEEARTAAQEEIEAWVETAEVRAEYIARFR